MSQPASGSARTTEDLQDYIEQLVRLFSKKKTRASDITPYQIVSGSGDTFYLAPQERNLIKVSRGSEIMVLPLEPDSLGRYHVVDQNGRYIMVPGDEILDIGFN